MQQERNAQSDEMAARITQLEADRDRLVGLLERAVDALDRLAPSTPDAITQTHPGPHLRLVHSA